MPAGDARSPIGPEALASIPESRREQMFPKFSSKEFARLRRFGELRRYAAGTKLFVTGKVAPGMFVVISGVVEIKRRDPLGRLAPIVKLGPGEFIAEVGQLSGRPSLVDADAVDEVEALLVLPENLRALLIAETELGDRIMPALILRRVTLIENGAGGPVLIGSELSPDIVRLQGFLARNGIRIRWSIRERIAMRPRSSSATPATRGSSRSPSARAERFCRIRARRNWLAHSGWCASTMRGELTMLRSWAGARRSRDRGLRRLRRPLGDRLRCQGFRRTGRIEHAHRELSRGSNRHSGPSARRPRVRPGAEIRSRNGNSSRGRAAVVQPGSVRSGIGRRQPH
jgi:hypothetical protein